MMSNVIPFRRPTNAASSERIELDYGQITRCDYDPSRVGEWSYFVNYVSDQEELTMWSGSSFEEAQAEARECATYFELPLFDETASLP